MKENFFNLLGEMTSKHDLLILRGHLLIEEQLNELIRIMAVHPKYLLNKRLTFDNKLSVIRSFHVNGSEKGWAIIESINKLRNDIAHSLPSERREDKILKVLAHPVDADFRGMFSDEQYDLLPKRTKHFVELQSAIYQALVFLHEHLERLKAEK